jgi:hypothetical protein
MCRGRATLTTLGVMKNGCHSPQSLRAESIAFPGLRSFLVSMLLRHTRSSGGTAESASAHQAIQMAYVFGKVDV